MSDTSFVTNIEEKNTPKITKNEIPAIEVIFSANLRSGLKIFSFLNPSNTVNIIKSVTRVCQSIFLSNSVLGFVINSEITATKTEIVNIISFFKYSTTFFITVFPH